MQVKHSRMLRISVTILGRALNSQINERIVCIHSSDISICQARYHSNNNSVSVKFLAQYSLLKHIPWITGPQLPCLRWSISQILWYSDTWLIFPFLSFFLPQTRIYLTCAKTRDKREAKNQISSHRWLRKQAPVNIWGF